MTEFLSENPAGKEYASKVIWLLTEFSLLNIVRLRVSATLWLLTRGCHQFLTTWASPNSHFLCLKCAKWLCNWDDFLKNWSYNLMNLIMEMTVHSLYWLEASHRSNLHSRAGGDTMVPTRRQRHWRSCLESLHHTFPIL